LGGVFAKNTSLEIKFPSPFGSGNFSSLDWYTSVSVKGKNDKYDFANTIKKVKSYANTPT
jgi:hypothetical protein